MFYSTLSKTLKEPYTVNTYTFCFFFDAVISNGVIKIQKTCRFQNCHVDTLNTGQHMQKHFI